jgi:hypothetical protein
MRALNSNLTNALVVECSFLFVQLGNQFQVIDHKSVKSFFSREDFDFTSLSLFEEFPLKNALVKKLDKIVPEN